MGVAARAAVAAGGEVLGIMPRHLMRPEHAAADLGTLGHRRHARRAQAAHDRMRQTSSSRSPAGSERLNELIEMLTLNDLGLQAKPVILCATDGFWEPFTALIERFGAYGVLRASIGEYLKHATSVGGDDAPDRRASSGGAVGRESRGV